jgi:phage terminase small subunit
MGEKLTSKQLKFIEVYAGNGTEAAKLAGYGGDENALGVTANRLLKNAKIAAAINARQAEKIRPLIATREERQAFWTKVLHDESEKMMDRLRASELLGKSEADFTEKVKLDGEVGVKMLSEKQSETIAKNKAALEKLRAANDAIADALKGKIK